MLGRFFASLSNSLGKDTPEPQVNNTSELIENYSTIHESDSSESTSPANLNCQNIGQKMESWRRRISSLGATDSFQETAATPISNVRSPELSRITEVSNISEILNKSGSSSSLFNDEDLMNMKKILFWLCGKVDPLLSLPENITNSNEKTDKLLAEHKQHIDHLQVQLDNIKQHIPNVTQLHYDRLQNEFEESNLDSPSITTNNNFNTLHHQSIDNELLDRLHEFDKRLIECEQYSRRENLIISGIPDSIPQKDLQGKVLEVLAAAGFRELRPDDIQACHRLGKPRNSRFPARVIVRFLSRKIVDFCLSNRDKIQQDIKAALNMNIRIYENLCKMNEESLHICKWLQDNGYIHDHFLRNGFVKIVCRAGERPMKVHHPEFLRNKFSNIPSHL